MLQILKLILIQNKREAEIVNELFDSYKIHIIVKRILFYTIMTNKLYTNCLNFLALKLYKPL